MVLLRIKEAIILKSWKIPVNWTMMGIVRIEADTLENAVEIAQDRDGIIPLPDDGVYMDGSWEVDGIGLEDIRWFYNNGEDD